MADGFKFKRAEFTGSGSGTNFGVFYNWIPYSSTIGRAQGLIAALARALMDMDIGWKFDPNYNITWIEDPEHTGCIIPSVFYDIPLKGSEERMPCLYLVNEISGNKLFIAYICTSSFSGIDLPVNQLFSSGLYPDPKYTGLIVSMIPGDANQSFGNPDNGTFLPSAGTRIYGLCEACGATSAKTCAYARANSNGTFYSYGILSTPYCIAIASGYSSDPTVPAEMKLCVAVGRVFGSLAHNETLPQSRYGVVLFTQSQGNNNQEAGQPKTLNINYGDATETTFSTQGFTNAYSVGSNNVYTTSAGSIFKKDGSVVGYSSTANIRCFPYFISQLCHYVQDPDVGGIRWTPYIVAVVSTNLSQDGIVPGDGCKGFLDTDLFRCARVERATKLDNGRFYGAGNNILLGWCPTNDQDL